MKRLSKLYFQHIHNTELQSRGVTVDDLAAQLERHGFIKLVADDSYIEIKENHTPEGKAAYFKAVWGTEPTRNIRRSSLFGICLLLVYWGLAYLGFPVVQRDSMALVQRRVLHISEPKLISLDLGPQAYRGGYLE